MPNAFFDSYVEANMGGVTSGEARIPCTTALVRMLAVNTDCLSRA